MQNSGILCLVLGAAMLLPRASGQSAQSSSKPAPKPAPDVLILNDDEKLLGHFVSSSGSSLIFKSDLLGALTIDWSKVKELHASSRYVVAGKSVSLGRRIGYSGFSTGSVDVSDKTFAVTPAEGGSPKKLPIADVAHVIEESEFEHAVMHAPGVFGAWKGAVTAGATLVEATQQSRVFTGAISLVRSVPTENWLASRNRTSINFSGSNGFQLQPGTPRIKTNILHGDAERDEYFAGSRVYGFGQAAFDHNFSQGLDLSQQYGGGIGWTAVKTAANILDLKGGLSYLNQQFATSTLNKSLAASTFSQSFTHRTKRGIVFAEQLSATPTWTDLNALQAAGNASVTVPVYKRLNFSLSLLDTYLHDPPPGFKKNSFQAATGLTYTLR